MLPPRCGKVRLEESQIRAAFDAGRTLSGRMGNGDRSLGRVAATGIGENHFEVRRHRARRQCHSGHRTWNLHGDDLIAAEYLGLPAEKVKFELGDTKFPEAPVQGGSFTTASVGTAIYESAQNIRRKLLELANKNAAFAFQDGKNRRCRDARRKAAKQKQFVAVGNYFRVDAAEQSE